MLRNRGEEDDRLINLAKGELGEDALWMTQNEGTDADCRCEQVVLRNLRLVFSHFSFRQDEWCLPRRTNGGH